MNKIEKQIKDTYEKAFYDIIDETVNSDKPDYDWIVKLYIEIKNRLLKYVKKQSKVYEQINDNFDIKIFRQLIENDVFNQNAMLQLIEKTFYWINKLQSPARDESTNESKNKILSSSPEKIVSTFIREVNKCLDYIDEDMINFFTPNKK